MKDKKMYIYIIMYYLVVISLITILNSNDKSIDKFYNNIINNKVESISEEDLLEYEKVISYELETTNKYDVKKKGDFCLVIIKYLENKYEESIQIGLKILEENSKEDKIDAMTMSVISNSYYSIKNKKMSNEYYNKAVNLCEELNEYEILCNIYYYKAKKEFLDNGKLDNVLALLFKSNEYDKDNKHSKRNSLFLAKIYRFRALYNKSNKLVIDATFDKFYEILNQIEEKSFEDNKMISQASYISLICLILIVISYVYIYFQNKKIIILNKNMKIDSLTGVYNRKFFDDTLESLAKEKGKVVFLMIDVDSFKKYNDNYGHTEGDEVLLKVAKLIEKSFIEDLVFRYGGEEFSIISRRDIKFIIEDVKKLQKNLHLENISHKYAVANNRITLSIGIEASEILSEDDIKKIINRADKKLYISKTSGRNRYTI